MEVINFLIDFVLHMDVHLNEIISNYGAWTYGILAGVVFMETGFVVTPLFAGGFTVICGWDICFPGIAESFPVIWTASYCGHSGRYSQLPYRPVYWRASFQRRDQIPEEGVSGENPGFFMKNTVERPSF